MITVIIPSYNSSNTICVPLDSLSSQSCMRFSVIIVDDCSDDSDQLLASVEPYRHLFSVSVIRHEKRLGGGGARNTGVNSSNTRFVAFLDSDDAWAPRRIEHLYQLIDSGEVDDHTLVYGRVNIYKGTRLLRVAPNRGILKNERVDEYVFAFNYCMQTSSFFCARELARVVGFDPRYTRHQDFSFARDVQDAGYKISFIAEPYVDYFFPQDGLRLRIAQRRIGEHILDADWYLDMFSRFSPKARVGYLFYVRSRVLFAQGSFLRSFWVSFSAFMHFRPYMVLRLITELYGIARKKSTG